MEEPVEEEFDLKELENIDEKELAEAVGEEIAQELEKEDNDNKNIQDENNKNLQNDETYDSMQKTLGNILNINWEELKKAKAKVTITIDFGG